MVQGNVDIPLTKVISAAPPIAVTDEPSFINENGIVRLKRARGKVKWTYDYEYPLEIICNINLKEEH